MLDTTSSTTSAHSAAERIFVALDYPSSSEAIAMIKQLAPLGVRFKLGLQLLTLLGQSEIQALNALSCGYFMDFKLHDIGQTVTKAVQSISSLDPAFVTIIAEPHIMRAAVAGRDKSALRLLGVTVLTSLDQQDLHESGYACTMSNLVQQRAQAAQKIGVDGLICSPHEVADLRTILGQGMILITPGVRPEGADAGDQKRVMTPLQALQAGADYLVIGRPITQAADPVQSAQAIIKSLVAAGY